LRLLEVNRWIILKRILKKSMKYELELYKVQWRVFLYPVMNLRGPRKVGYLTSWATIRLWGTILLYIVNQMWAHLWNMKKMQGKKLYAEPRRLFH
jgi:hypothetical protein